MVDSPKADIAYTPCKLFSHPLIGIDAFTIKKPNKLRKLKYKVITENNYYIHQKIKFIILAELIQEMKEILYSPKRNNKCGELSFQIAISLKENCRIVTAICIDPFNQEHKTFLHTFIIITNSNGKEFCMDATINAVIEKKVYLELLQAKIISDIPNENLKQDNIIINQANIAKHLNLAEYLCFPEQITSTAKKLVKKQN